MSAAPQTAETPEAPRVSFGSDRRGGRALIFKFAFDELLNAAVKRLPGRRFDWESREWIVPARPEFAEEFAELLAVFPRIEVAPEVSAWLSDAGWRGVASVRDLGYGPTLAVRSLVGIPPVWLDERGEEDADGRMSLPLDLEVARLASEVEGLELDNVADAAVDAVLSGAQQVGARLDIGVDDQGIERFELIVGVHVDTAAAFLGLTEAQRVGPLHGIFALAEQRDLLAVPADAALLEELDDFLDDHEGVVIVGEQAELRRRELRDERRRAKAIVALSVADDAELDLPALGGELRPFQRAGVRYALAQRHTFLADEQGLGKTVQALATLESDDAYPCVVVCPASMKLTWEREVAHWLPHRTTAVLHGRSAAGFKRAGARRADIVILNYEIVEGHVEALAALEPRALVFDESHYCKQPRAKRTKACLSLSAQVPRDSLRLALTGTPILNRPKELVSQLRLIGRLSDFESGAGMARRFRGPAALERLHWHLRSHCYVRRLKADVLPQLPPKRQVPIPVELSNETEYRLAERDLIAWLQSQPNDLRSVESRIAAALRNERLVQLNHLRQLAGRGKLNASLAWIADFLESGEPLVVFADHVDVQHALVERFPDAVHVLGDDNVGARDTAVTSFQRDDGPQLIVCSLRAAGQGITLTRASNVAFLELDWTPARLAQAEDRCHRIGQADAVTAWYLLAPETIDETMAELLEHKRGVIGAVTDGHVVESESLIEGVIRALRERELDEDPGGVKYVAFLRGINLGKNRRVRKEALCAAFEDAAADDVTTFRASGNVVFSTAARDSEAKLTKRIEEALEAALGYDVRIFLRGADELRAIAAHEPFPAKQAAASDGKLQVDLLAKPPSTSAREEVLALATDEDRLAFGDRELYWLPSGRQIESELDLNAIQKLVGPTTKRTMGTIEQIAAKYFAA